MTVKLTQKTVHVDVELPDLGKMIADIIEAYDKKIAEAYQDYHISTEEQAKIYTRIWLDMQFKCGETELVRRQYELSRLSLKNGE